jgi:hypothetical protein
MIDVHHILEPYDLLTHRALVIYPTDSEGKK